MQSASAHLPTPPATSARTDAEVVALVADIVAESLACDRSQVHAGAILMEDLGAESLDFLDIVFKVERAFGIQITRGEMERAARGDMDPDAFAPDGVISDAGLARLRELMPEAASRVHPGLRPGQILTLFSVQTFANMVRAKLAGQSV